MAMKSSFLNFTSKKSPSIKEAGHHGDDNASVISDATYATDGGWATRLGLNRAGDPSLDDIMKNLYQDPDILEERCRDAAAGLTRRKSIGTSSEGSGSNHGGADGTEKEAWQKALASGVEYMGIKASKTPEEVIAGLHEGFFSPDFDPTEKQLMEISQWEDEGLTDRFMATIEETDTDKDMVLSQLADMISLNYSDLMSCMRDVHAIDMDLARTGIQLTNSRRKLESGKQLIVTGTLGITRLQRRKENLTQVYSSLQRLQFVRGLYEQMLQSVKIGDVGRAAESSYRVLMTMQDDSYYCLKSVQGYGEGVQRMLPALRHKTDKALFRLASRRFAAPEYEGIVRSYLLLDHMQESLGVRVVARAGAGEAGDGDAEVVFDEDGCMEGLARRIQRYQMADIGACMHSTVLELMYAHANAAAAKGQADANLQMVDLPELSREELYERITPGIVVPCVVRGCEMLASVIHTNYLITQWHKSPFDERNNDMRYLHRCPIDHGEQDFSDTDSEEEDDEEGGRRRAESTERHHQHRLQRRSQEGDVIRDSIISSDIVADGEGGALSPEDVRHLRLQSARLTDANQSLVACRFILWEEVERAIVDLLHAISPSAAIPLEDFASMLWALDTIIKLGREFCNAESRGLKHVVALKSVEYANSIHLESFRYLQQLLESEPWRSVPIQLGEVGGILGIIKMYALKHHHQSAGGGVVEGGRIRIRGMVNEAMEAAQRRNLILAANRSSLAAKYTNTSVDTEARSEIENVDADKGLEESILMSFHSSGNPLHFMTAGADEDADGDEIVSEKVDGIKRQVSGSSTGDQVNGTGHEVNLLMEALSKLLEDDTAVPLSRRAQQQTSAMVVTQASLHGLAKLSGRYLHMMQLMPAAAPEIFNGLCQLFDFYLCAVFIGFVSSEERSRLFTKNLPRSIAPPPLQAKDFEALAHRMQFLFSLSSSGSRGLLSGVGVGGRSPGQLGGPGSNSGLWAEDGVQFTNIFCSSDVLKNLQPPHAVQFPEPSSFNALNERVVAAESCWFAAKILGEIKPKVLSLLPEAHKQTSENHISDFQQISGQLRSLVYRAMCPDLVKQNEIVSIMLEQSGWDQKKMREEPHEWVDTLIDNCIDVWEYMEAGDEFAEASTLVREQVWLEICQAAFDAVLEGLSRVRKCSTEGRASMTMDVSALHTGLDSRHVCRPPRGRQYVDMYIKALYLTEDETIRWALSQCQTYAHRHLAGLLKQALSSMMSNRKLSQALTALDAEYDNAEKEESKLSNMLSQRLR